MNDDPRLEEWGIKNANPWRGSLKTLAYLLCGLIAGIILSQTVPFPF